MTHQPFVSIHIAETDTDIRRCLPVLSELRPDLSPETFVPTIRRMQNQGYFLVMLETAGEVAAVASYRFGEHLARGSFLYIDDLVTASPFRRQGYAQKLFNRLVHAAKSSGCAELHLDSEEGTEAHQFYQKQNMTSASRHYALKLKAT